MAVPPASTVRPRGPAWSESTQASQRKVAAIGMERARCSQSIQAPGRGTKLARRGARARSRKGSAKPRPRATKIPSA